MAVLGVAASMAAPSAGAAPAEQNGSSPNGFSTNALTAHWLRLRSLKVLSNFDMYLIPAHANYWSATNSARHVALVDEIQLANGYFYVEAVGLGIALISLTGKGGEYFSIRIEVN
jgi:hypothetical protein